MGYLRISPMPVDEGGTGATTLTDHSVLLGSGTAAVTALTNGTTGQVLTAVTGSDPAWATPAPSFTWNEETTTGPTAMVVNNGYISNNGATVTFTLPTTSAVGDVIRVAGSGAGGWTVTYTTGQSIVMGLLTSTITTGNIASSNRYDAVELICITANTTWSRISSTGNITVV